MDHGDGSQEDRPKKTPRLARVMQVLRWLPIGLFAVGIFLSLRFAFQPGLDAGWRFAEVMLEMVKILPCAIVLVALFEQWVSRETVVRHLGPNCGARGYCWALLLGGMSIGGLYVAFPLAYSLRGKGASLKVVFAYVGFAGVCRIPMTLFEASFLGLPFTLLRLAVAIPAMFVFAWVLGGVLERRGYEIRE